MGILARAFKKSFFALVAIASLFGFVLLLIMEIDFIQSIVENQTITILIVVAVNTLIGVLIEEIYNYFLSIRNK